MISILGLTSLAVCILSLAIRPFHGILITFILKPFIDAAFLTYVGPLRVTEIFGVAVPLLLLPRIWVFHGAKFSKMPFAIIATIYLFSNLVGLALIFESGNTIGAANVTFRILSGYLGFFVLPLFINDRRKFKLLLITLLIAGLYPLGTSLFQSFTGHAWYLRQATGFTRNVGVYHDAFAMRIFIIQTGTAILLYWSYFTSGKPFQKMILGAYGSICIVALYNLYSKSAILVAIIWYLVWTVFQKKYIWLLMIPFMVIALNLLSGEKLINNVAHVFYKEIGAVEGTIDQRHVLSGRTVMWKDYFNRWLEAPIYNKLFGDAVSGAPHNDYLRVLITNGIFGLLIYLFLLSSLFF